MPSRRLRSFYFGLYAMLLCLGATRLAAQITVGVAAIPDNLHPYSVQANDELLNFYQRPLVRPTSKYQWDCILCEDIPTLENNQAQVEKRGKVPFLQTHWKIRKDAIWDDGKPITAADVVFTWQVLKSFADAKIFNHPILYEIDDIKAGKDPKEFDIIYIGLSSDYQRLPNFFIIPQHIEQKPWDACGAKPTCYMEQTFYRTQPATKGLYNGPFIPAANRTQNQVTLTSNSAFKFKPKPGIATVTVKSISHSAELNEQLSSYDVVLPGVLNTLDALALEKKTNAGPLKGDYKFFYTESDRLELLVFNARNPIFSDIKVREAVSLAIDRKALLAKVFLGSQRVVKSMFDQPWWPHDTNLTAPDYAPDKARKILDNDGWGLKDDHIRRKEQQILQMMITITSGDRTRAAIADGLKAQLNQVGFSVTVQEVGHNDFSRSVLSKAEFRDAVLVSWDLNQGLLPKSLLHSKEVPNFSNQYYGQNIGGWRNSEADELLEKLESAFDPKEKLGLVTKLVEKLYQEVPHIPLYFTLVPSLQKKTVQGFVPTAFAEPASGYAEFWRTKP